MEQFRHALDQLHIDAREVLILYYREGQSTRQVAALLDLSESAVRQRLTRARQRLRSDWEQQVRDVSERGRPGEAFSMGVLGAIAGSSQVLSKVAAAKVVAKAGLHAVGWKSLGLLFSASVVPALIGCASVVLGMHKELQRAKSDEELRALRGIRAAAIALLCFTAGLFAWSAVSEVRTLAIAGYLFLCSGLGYLFLYRLPRVTAASWVRRLEEDPAAADVLRWESQMRWVGFLAGVLMGAAGLAAGLWLTR